MTKWLIYSKHNCPYCDKAKFELQHEESVEVRNISENPEFLKELMEKNPAARTMPQIYKDDQLVGGYDNLKALLEVSSGSDDVIDVNQIAVISGGDAPSGVKNNTIHDLYLNVIANEAKGTSGQYLSTLQKELDPEAFDALKNYILQQNKANQ